MHEIVNRGLIKSLNEVEDPKEKVAIPLSLLKVKLNKLEINSLAEVGF